MIPTIKAISYVVSLIILVTLFSAATASIPGEQEQKLPGMWRSIEKKEDVTLEMTEKGTYRWNKEEGRYAVKESTIWFLNKENTGTKWDFSFKENLLILEKPEDFKYLGSGKYYYFRMTDPKTVLKFVKTKKDTEKNK